MSDSQAQGGSTTTTGPLKTPIAHPLPDCKPAPPAPLTTDQQTKYDTLLAKAKAITDITCTKSSGAAAAASTTPSSSSSTPQSSSAEPKQALSGPITEREQSWLTRECLLRYLRASKWSVDDAHKRLLSTLAWRREYGIEHFSHDYISPEQETGKELLLGFDKEGRPCQYLTPNRQNTDAGPRQLHHLFYMVERVVEMMPPGVEKLSLLINFKPSKKRQNTSVGIGMAREVLHILQNHYPERLGKALIINVPWVVWGFFKLINPFIDPVTREKLKFNEDMTLYVPPAQLWKEDWGGALDFDYDHALYWPALDKLCRQRREDRFARWKAAGGVVGETELFLTAGTDVSVTGFQMEGAPGNAALGEHSGGESSSHGAEVTEKMADMKMADEAVAADKPAVAV